MTVREIAERLQYHKPQNFIRSFRKKSTSPPANTAKQGKRFEDNIKELFHGGRALFDRLESENWGNRGVKAGCLR